jgi:hypothetical protein
MRIATCNEVLGERDFAARCASTRLATKETLP